ncbi:HD domain-containing protein [Petropleomorpha daqingensis]|uniref:(P)ppGpp synthase/HD superfamily hydrolase n=1 Tax=Petropleomorpha daqingensis TaxID=2026353 RepID=A0A853CCM7_9ACTN|nr:HD domain-containing protein [Petropleomorpha daqingensis]NYJ03913.1 (p)ppGpp synthase/HD superfamily hydrolase [Petropleomorpha daqingensis]
MATTAPTLEARTALGAGALGKRFADALDFAFERHRLQVRKGSRVPYLSRLMSVCALAIENGGRENQAIAALLHDAVEDAATGQGRTFCARSATCSAATSARWSRRAATR